MKSHKPLLPQTKETLAYCFFGLLILTGINTAIGIHNSLSLSAATQKRTTFVQLVNGKASLIKEEDRLYRDPTLIKETVKSWNTLTFNLDNRTTPQDAGMPLPNNNQVKLPTRTYFASLLLEPKFALASLPKLANLVPQGYWDGSTWQIIHFGENGISDPIQTAPGQWKVIVNSVHITKSNNGAESRTKFNRIFFIRAIEPTTAPLAENTSPSEQAVYGLLSGAVQIYDIKPYQPES